MLDGVGGGFDLKEALDDLVVGGLGDVEGLGGEWMGLLL